MRKIFKKIVAGALSSAMILGLGTAYVAPAKVSKAAVTGAKKSYRAFISYQTSAYAFRDLWYDGVGSKDTPSYGIEQNVFQLKAVGNAADQYVSYSPLLNIATHSIGKYDSKIANYSSELKDMAWQGGPYNVDYTECEITGPGTYSVKMELPETWTLMDPTNSIKKELATNSKGSLFEVENANANTYTDQDTGATKKCQNIFKFVFADTDIPRSFFDNGKVKFTNVKLLVDGVEVNNVANATAGTKGNGGVKDDETSYCVLSPLNYYDSTSEKSEVCKQMKFTYPKKTLEVQFTVSGDIFDANGGNSASTAKYAKGLLNAQNFKEGFAATVAQAQNADGTFPTVYQYADRYGNVNTAATKEEAAAASKAVSDEVKDAAAAVTCAGVTTGGTFTASNYGVKAKVLKSALSDGTQGTVALTGTTSKKITSFEGTSVIYYNGYAYKVTQVASKAFASCTKLTDVTLGSNITTINANAFYNCKKLQYMKFTRVPSTVKKNAFKGCKKKIYVSGKSPKKVVKKLKSGSKYKKIAVDPGQEKIVNKLYN